MTGLGTAAFALAALLQAGQNTVQVTPEAPTLRVGETITLQARVLDGSGRARTGHTVRWFTPTSEFLSVDDRGRVTALKAGTGSVVANAADAVGTAELTVLPPAVAELVAVDALDPLVAGTSGLWAFDGRAADGSAVPDPEVEITSADPSVAFVDATGRIHARRAGTVRMTARALDGDASVAATLEIRADPGLTFQVVEPSDPIRTGDVWFFDLDVGGGDPAGMQPLWTVVQPGAEISTEGAQGAFVAEAPGRYTVMAVIGESSARTTTIDVTPREYEAKIELVGRGVIADHNSADMWVFEGVDGRDYMYVGTYMHDWMKVWDVTDPAAPVLTDSLQFDARRINDVKIHPRAHLGIATREQASNRRNGMMLLDLSDPAHPTLMSEYSATLTGGVHNVWIDGENELVYAVHNGTSDVHIVDISDPLNPSEVGRWGLERERKTLHDVIVQDGYAYLSYWRDGVVTLDVGAGTHGGTPTEPAFVSRYEYPIWNTHTAWRAGKYLITGDENFPAEWDPTGASPIEARGYIHFIDMSDMDNPVEVAKYEVPEAGAHNVWVEGDRLYIGYYQAGLRVVDISGELRGDLYRQGREVAHLDMRTLDSRVPNWPMAFNAQVHKGFLYSSDMNSGIWITKLEENRRVVF